MRSESIIHSREEFIKLSKTTKDFSHRGLAGLNLSGLNLQSYKFVGSDFFGTDLSYANIRGADFSGANLMNAKFEGVKAGGTNFEGANLNHATFEGAYLFGANFKNAEIKSTIFTDAKTSGTNFFEAKKTVEPKNKGFIASIMETAHYPIPIALEVLDIIPPDWPDSLKSVFTDNKNKTVYKDPIRWAVFCQDTFNPDAICLRLIDTHPDNGNKSPAQAAELVQKILRRIRIPLIILGSNHLEKDKEVLKACAEKIGNGRNKCLIGKAQEKNYKTIAAAAMPGGHSVVALSNLDINLAKQLYILLATEASMPEERIIMDPMVTALGYGFEYSYSLIERIRQDPSLRHMPILGDVGIEAWKVKEAKKGNATEGIQWEFTTAIGFVLAGVNMLILRHPETLKRIRSDLHTMDGI